MRYKQLTLAKRYHISALHQQGLKQYEIAKEIGVHPSTISRELRRNSSKTIKQRLHKQKRHYDIKRS